MVDSELDKGYPSKASVRGHKSDMSHSFFFEVKFWTVSEVTYYLRDLLESDHALQDIWVQGEISSVTRPSSGHLYFTIKDRESTLRCVMWKNFAERMGVTLDEGQSVETHGKISIYPVSGQYQLYVDAIRPIGEGILYQEFLRLKSRLEAEGLFDADRKRPIPAQPNRIGIVTSPTGAALQDILNTFRRRFPLVEVILAPTAVQGIEAPQGIINALKVLNRKYQPDVILVARGGGSIEDLWAFNDEQVVRAIAESNAPVISGIGHETDFTIADFVSDLRAPTPTAAAELATPNKIDLISYLRGAHRNLESLLRDQINSERLKVDQSRRRMLSRSPEYKVQAEQQRIDDSDRRLVLAFDNYINENRMRLNGFSEKLAAMNLNAILKRGFAIVSGAEGAVIRSVEQVKPGDEVLVRVQDGSFESKVQNVTPS